MPDIDLFATNINNKCERYVSWHPDPYCFAVDAFSLCWTDFYFYAFPPFSLVLRSLNKIIADKAEGILVVPKWDGQPWYPLFNKLLVQDPLVLESHNNLLNSLSSQRSLPDRISLVVGRLSGKPF